MIDPRDLNMLRACGCVLCLGKSAEIERLREANRGLVEAYLKYAVCDPECNSYFVTPTGHEKCNCGRAESLSKYEERK